MERNNATINKRRVLVAMSGGVDSSVSVALLQEQGYHVEGAFIVTWTAPWLPCTWREEREDAKKVADQLGIPFHTVDLSHEYEHDVVDYFVAEYKAGRTPNPDVMCNKYIKFGGLYDWAREREFEYLATGHYARVEKDEQGMYHLYAGLDRNKDQSYFLWTLTQEQLAHTLFPVGNLEKPDVRALAQHYELPVAEKKDSQGVCFLGKVDMHDFLLHYFPARPGDVLNLAGEIVGTHDGAVFFTLGQRHGFFVEATSPDAPRLYVVAKDIEANTITVAPEASAPAEGEVQQLLISDCNWIGTLPEQGTLQARLRYRQRLFETGLATSIPTSLSTSNGPVCALATPAYPQPFVPLGQSIVFYSSDECLGGGILAGEERIQSSTEL
jgi:tRNA-specific 2-thiouridylase